jgi:heat shock protein HslJ
MRVTLSSLGVIMLVAAGCGANDDVSGSGHDELVGRTFISQSVTDEGEPRPLVDDTVIRLSFNDDGSVSAHAGCNHLFADVVSLSEGTITVTGVGSTEMGCLGALHDQDAWLSSLIGSNPGWTLAGDTLTLTSAGTQIVLLDRVVADPDRPFVGTRWIVDTLIEGDTASSVPTEAVAELWFTADGRVEGSGGCNEIWGSYEVARSTITFRELAQTDMECDTEAMELEHAVSAALAGTVEFDITARRLTLTNSDGLGLGLHAAD